MKWRISKENETKRFEDIHTASIWIWIYILFPKWSISPIIFKFLKLKFCVSGRNKRIKIALFLNELKSNTTGVYKSGINLPSTFFASRYPIVGKEPCAYAPPLINLLWLFLPLAPDDIQFPFPHKTLCCLVTNSRRHFLSSLQPNND